MAISYTSTSTQNSSTPRSTTDRRARRDELVREYNQQSASRARWARLSTQDAINAHKQNSARAKARALERAEYENRQKERNEIEAKKRERDRERAASEARTHAGKSEKTEMSRTRTARRVVEPLSSREYQEKTRRSFEHYERERAVRDPYQRSSLRSGERQVIDGRGTIDSRAFNELDIITNKTIDDQDKHDATLTVSDSPRRWKTSSRNAADSAPSIGQVGSQGSGLIDSYKQLPPFVQIAIPVILILLLILIFLLLKG